MSLAGYYFTIEVMAFRDLFSKKPRPDYLAGPAGFSGVLSPYADSESLTPAVAWNDWLSVGAPRVLSREAALQVPAVAKVRNVLTTTIAPLPLRVLNKDGILAEQPSWAYRTDGDETPFNRMFNIVQDLLFDGLSILAVQRGTAGQVLAMAHVSRGRVSTDGNGALLIDGQHVDESAVVFIKAPYNGILRDGSATIAGARDLELAWQGRSRNPIPLVHIQRDDTGEGPLTNEERKALIDGYRAARQDVDGAILFTEGGYTVTALGTAEADLFESGRNAATTSIGQISNVRASMLDGTLADSSSLTYVTSEGERSAFLVFDIPFYTSVIEQRLSQDDVVPAGQRVRFDMTALQTVNPPATGAPLED